MKTWATFIQEMQTPIEQPPDDDYKGRITDMLTRELLQAIQRNEPETVKAIKRVMFNAGIPGAGSVPFGK